MPEVVAILIDNGMESQNEDYLPNRFYAQIEAASRIVTNMLEDSVENKIGIITAAQETENDIVTPTSEKQGLLNYIYRCDLQENTDWQLALYQVDQCLELSELAAKKLIMFISSKIKDKAQLIYELSRLEDKNVEIKLVCFGDAIEFGNEDANVLKSDLFDVITLLPEDDFDIALENFCKTNYEDDDDLKEAIRLSKLVQ